MSKPINPPLKWHGGKHYLAKKIIDLMPPHLHYVEPYAGGLAVLLAKNPEGVSEVVNDLNFELTNFWNVLSGKWFEEFKRLVEATPFSEWHYRCSEILRSGTKEMTGPMPAHQFFMSCRMSLSGRMDTFAPLSKTRTRRGMNEQASAWLTAIEGLPEVHARLKRVVILNRDALDVIRQQDGEQTLFYLDPPYLEETRTAKRVYQHEMSSDDKSNHQIHQELLEMLTKIKGKFLLSGYHSGLYDRAAAENRWRCHEFEIPNNAAGGKSKRRMTECVWMNYEPAK